MGDSRGVQGVAGVRRTSVLRRVVAVRTCVVRQQPAGLFDVTAGTGRLRGSTNVLAAYGTVNLSAAE